MDEKDDGHGARVGNPDNPGRVVSIELCQAYRETVDSKLVVLDEKINGLRNTIVTGLAISTSVVSIVVVVMNLLK